MSSTFTTNMTIPSTETIGPKTNSRSVAILHPDMHQSSPDVGRLRITQRRVDRSVYLPDKDLANIVKQDNYEINENGLTVRPEQYVYGEEIMLPSKSTHVEEDPTKAKYLKDNYGIPSGELKVSDNTPLNY